MVATSLLRAYTRSRIALFMDTAVYDAFPSRATWTCTLELQCCMATLLNNCRCNSATPPVAECCNCAVQICSTAKHDKAKGACLSGWECHAWMIQGCDCTIHAATIDTCPSNANIVKIKQSHKSYHRPQVGLLQSDLPCQLGS